MNWCIKVETCKQQKYWENVQFSLSNVLTYNLDNAPVSLVVTLVKMNVVFGETPVDAVKMIV